VPCFHATHPRINSANNTTKRFSKNVGYRTRGFNSEVSTVYYGGELIHFLLSLMMAALSTAGKKRYCSMPAAQTQ